jgi:hypothetical protein
VGIKIKIYNLFNIFKLNKLYCLDNMIKSQLVKQFTTENFFFSKGNKVWVENYNSKHFEDDKEEPYDLVIKSVNNFNNRLR